MSTEPTTSPVRRFTELVGIAVVAALLFVGLFVVVNPLAPVGGLEPSKPAPAIHAAGWLNGEPPDDLRGNVVVVVAWATWCGPCRAKIPELVATRQRFRDRPVAFIGLTAEGEEAVPDMQELFEAAGVDWPNGYGAANTLVGFQNSRIPAIWLVGPDGVVRWNVDSPQSLEDAIEDALQQVDAASSGEADAGR